MNEYELDVLSLESSFNDPKVSHFMQNALLANEYLAEGDIAEADAVDVIDTLQQEFAELELNGEQVFITGYGWIVSSGNTDSDGNLILGESSHMTLQDQEVHLSGIVIQEAPKITDDGVSMERKVYLFGRTPIAPSEEDEDDDVDEFSIEECVIAITPETIIRHEGLTVNKAEAWLDLYYPEEKETIFELCANADDEADALRMLGDYTINTSNMSRDIAIELGNNIEVYLASQLNLVADLPYIVRIAGEIQLSSAESMYQELTVSEMHGEEFMYLYDIHCTHDTETEVIRPWIEGAVVRRDNKGKVSCRLPVAHFQSITSIRRLVN